MIKLKAFGEEKTFQEWGKDPRCSVPVETIRYRICCLGWSSEDAISRSKGKSPKEGCYTRLKTNFDPDVVKLKMASGREWKELFSKNGGTLEWMNRDKRGVGCNG